MKRIHVDNQDQLHALGLEMLGLVRDRRDQCLSMPNDLADVLDRLDRLDRLLEPRPVRQLRGTRVTA